MWKSRFFLLYYWKNNSNTYFIVENIVSKCDRNIPFFCGFQIPLLTNQHYGIRTRKFNSVDTLSGTTRDPQLVTVASRSYGVFPLKSVLIFLNIFLPFSIWMFPSVSLGVKRLKRELSHSISGTGEINNANSFISTLRHIMRHDFWKDKLFNFCFSFSQLLKK
jgi:hypothetical protein